MLQNEQNSGTGFALGVLVGALAGAGIALLFAPKPGAQLRGEIGESVGSMRDAAARRMRDVADRAGSQLNDLSASVSKVKGAVASTARDMADGAAEQLRPENRSRM